MPDFQLAVIDVDGTLINKQGKISAADKEAIGKARDKGILVALSTGRVVPACTYLLEELGLDGFHIFCDGALVYNPATAQTCYSQPLCQGPLLSAIEFVREHNIYLELYTILDYYVEYENWSAKMHREFFRISPTVTDFKKVALTQDVQKIELMVHDQTERRGAELFMSRFEDDFQGAELFMSRFEDDFHFSIARAPAYPEVEFVNIVSPGISKGRALEKMAAQMGISLRNVIAFGDGSNDLPLFRAAGFGVAMGNARAELKEIADYVTLDVEESGLAAAFNKFLI
ncbi:Cof-type HAD-IIB family hydrolase [Dehalococcoides mccartyi]|uniref:Cof-type HAD-IIB family hydrolase n=1 Tax=Dehalococcoides mccartyi TaxID=61435 RepID=UPI001AFA57B9|nr:Cof-type HAD-IIB family hydrolase [Dehalococcoides mccartyi]BCT56198.1 HAD-superfamily hydrolase, subfamily IIB [Dehalococcoides mccartyi]